MIIRQRSDNGGDWFVLEIPRCDTNEMGEYEVTVTSDTHKQREPRNRKQKRKLQQTAYIIPWYLP